MLINRKKLKEHTSRLLSSSQLLAMCKELLKRRALVLTFHHVIDDDNKEEAVIKGSTPWIRRTTFAKLIEYINMKYNIISLGTLINCMLEKRKFPPKACVMTFDDGWQDNYKNAFPILKTYGLPATIFLITDYIGTNKFTWQERLYSVLKAVPDRAALGEAWAAIGKSRLSDATLTRKSDKQNEYYRNLVAYLKRLPGNTKERFISRLENGANISLAEHSSSRRFLNRDELQEMIASDIEIGSHTCSHSILTNESSEVIKEELHRSREQIESILSYLVRFFSYPNGDYNKGVVDEVAKAGYKAALTTKERMTKMNDNCYLIPRFDIHESRVVDSTGVLSADLFELSVNPVWTIVRSLIKG